jgi:hypothetical protein
LGQINENIALAIAYSSILSSLIASSLIIEETLFFAHIELKSITAQWLIIVFSLIAHNLAQCLILKHIPYIALRDKIHSLLHLLSCPNRKHRPTSLEVVVGLTL